MREQTRLTFARDTHPRSVIRGVRVGHKAGIIREPLARGISPILLSLEILYDLMPRIWNSGDHNADIMMPWCNKSYGRFQIYGSDRTWRVWFSLAWIPGSGSLSKTIKILG